MNFKEIMWQKFAGNLCINYLWCLYEFILADHIRNPEGVTRWIKHKVTGSLHKRIYKLQTDNVKTALEFENYKQQLFRLPCGTCEHKASTRSVSARDRSSDTKCTLCHLLYFFTELRTYHLCYSIYKHDAIDIADPSSTQDAYRTWTS